MSTQPVEPTPAPVYERPTAVPAPAPSSGVGSLAFRIGLTLLGAAGLIVGSMSDWFRSVTGTSIALKALWGSPDTTRTFAFSVGFVTIIVGLLAIIGLSPRSGWLTRLAGTLGIVAAVLFLIQVYRAPGAVTAADLGIGFWLVVAGSLAALIGGFFGTRYRVAYPAPAPAPTVVEPTV